MDLLRAELEHRTNTQQERKFLQEKKELEEQTRLKEVELEELSINFNNYIRDQED